MTDVSPDSFDLIGAIEGTTYPEDKVPFLFDAQAANALANMKKELDKFASIGRSAEYNDLEPTYLEAVEALKPVTYIVEIKSVPREVRKAVLAEASVAFPPKYNPLTNIEEPNPQKQEFLDMLVWRSHITRFVNPDGKVVDGPLSRETVQMILDKAPDASIAAVSEAIRELQDGAKSGYEQIVQSLDF